MPDTLDITAERARMVREARDLIDRRGEAVTKNTLVAETGLTRARIDAIFPEEGDLFAAIVDDWYAPDTEIMEEVVANDLPIQRKMYEFFARRFAREKERYEADPAMFALYLELGTDHFEMVQGYIELADHYLAEVIAQAQAEGHFPNLTINEALSLINQMVLAYTSPQVMLMFEQKLTLAKLDIIIGTLFSGLDGGKRVG